MLLLSTAVTALGSWILVVAPGFTTFLIGWAIQGAYVVWLPLEVAIIYRRTKDTGRQALLTRRAAAILVGALELSVIIGAVTSGLLVEATSMAFLLALPAIVVTVVFFVIWFGIEDVPGDGTGGYDWGGLALVTLAIGLVMGGLVAIRVQGPDSVLPWILILLGLGAFVPFVRYEQAHPAPMIDVRLMATRGQWPVQLTAFLFGMSVLGAQIPLSTFARTDPDVAGYGLGASAGFVSTLIGVYVIFLAIGAFTLPLTARLLGPRNALVASSLLVALGYALWLPFHDTTTQGLVNMAVAGLGSGALVAALPAAAASRRPAGTHRLRHRHDQRDQDHRRCHRVRDLRHRADQRGFHRGPGGGPGAAVGLPHRLGDLRGGRTARRGGADDDAQGRTRGRARRSTTSSTPSTPPDPPGDHRCMARDGRDKPLWDPEDAHGVVPNPSSYSWTHAWASYVAVMCGLLGVVALIGALAPFSLVRTVGALGILAGVLTIRFADRASSTSRRDAAPVVRRDRGDGRRWRRAVVVHRLTPGYRGGVSEQPTAPDDGETRSRMADKAAARARIEQQQTWVDLQVRQAMERGDFDDLPGAGKPIADLGEHHDPDWWIKKLVERENIAVLPPSVQLRKEDAELDDAPGQAAPARTTYAASSTTSTSGSSPPATGCPRGRRS